MHWLQSLDTALFHFINSTFSNPVCDWLMPVVSGGNGAMPWFVLLAVVAFTTAMIRGGARGRICAVLLLVVVAAGDPLIVGTIKHAVSRPRPCLALPDVVERLGCSSSGSMPSAHAANWFACAMIMFLFYRRSGWIMFPLAATVAFSRVYCGVHYPSDVCTGAILGAGYAIALVVLVQTIWNFIGRKFFPLWHERLPNLLNPKPSTFNLQPAALDSHWLKLGYAVILIALVARWFYLRSGLLDLSGDEAYQWTWSKHLALSYYSKPLGIALLQKLGTLIGGDTGFGVRFCSPVIAAIMSLLLLRFLAREAGGRTAFWALIATLATPLFVVGS